jgi:hypothetical protein
MIIKKKYLTESFNENNLSFSLTSSRPSRSLVSVGLFKEYIKINRIFDQFSTLKTNEIILSEILLYFFRYELVDYENKNNSVVIVNKKTTIHLVNESSLKETVNSILNVSILPGDFLLIKMEDIYQYPNIELIILICYSFDGCKIYRSKIDSLIYIVYYSFNKDLIDLKKLFSKWEKSIRFIGINVPIDVQRDILYFNDSFFKRSIEECNKLHANMSIVKNDRIQYEKNVNNDYFMEYLNTCKQKCEKCILEPFITYNCKICVNCYSLFS